MRPGIEPASSWILVGFVPSEPQRELHIHSVLEPLHGSCHPHPVIVLGVDGPIQTDDLLFPLFLEHFSYYYWDSFLPVNVVSLFCFFNMVGCILKHIETLRLIIFPPIVDHLLYSTF